MPSDTSSAFASANLFPTNEFIAVSTNMVPLLAGDWYLAVYTRTNINLTYSIRASEVLAANVGTLTNGGGYPGTTLAANNAAANGISYYRFVVASTAVQANFEILNPSGDVDLYIRKDLPLPSASNFAYSSANGGTTNEFIAVVNSAGTVPLSGGDWYLAVVNRTNAPVSYVVRVTQFAESLVPPTLIRLSSGVAYTNTITTNGLWFDGIPHYYVFNVSSNAQWATFEIDRPTNTVEMVIRKGLPLPTGSLWDYQTGLNSGPNTTDRDQFWL